MKNTQFNNLVHYETLHSNSSKITVDFQSSADPSSLSALIKDNQLIDYSLLIPQEQTVPEEKQEDTSKQNQIPNI